MKYFPKTDLLLNYSLMADLLLKYSQKTDIIALLAVFETFKYDTKMQIKHDLNERKQLFSALCICFKACTCSNISVLSHEILIRNHSGAK